MVISAKRCDEQVSLVHSIPGVKVGIGRAGSYLNSDLHIAA